MTVQVAPRIDNAAPPEGKRLNMGSVAGSLGVSFTDLQHATGLSRGALFRLATENRWPAGYEPAAIKRDIEQLLAEHGASAAQLATLWHAYSRSQVRAKLQSTDVRGKPLMGPPAPPPPPTPPRVRPSRARPAPEPKDTDMLLAKQTLSAAARKHFALFTNPFDGEVTCSEELFVSAELRFVRECAWQAATGGRYVAVVGESGSGKSTLLADLKERIHTDRKPVRVIEPSVLGTNNQTPLRIADILTALIMSLAPGVAVAQTSEKRTRQAEQLLTGSTGAGNNHLLLVEEAHSLSVDTLRHLKRLNEKMRLHGRKPMLGILLLAQPELLTKLDESQHNVREVTQRLEIVQLQPLDTDLPGYLQHRCKAAGRELGSFLAPDAVDALRARLTVVRQGVRNSAVSLVYPLAVNNLVTAALNTAAELGVPVVTADVVQAV
jgi:type II secretory pathway predicted ATPase ExeA